MCHVTLPKERDGHHRGLGQECLSQNDRNFLTVVRSRGSCSRRHSKRKEWRSRALANGHLVLASIAKVGLISDEPNKRLRPSLNPTLRTFAYRRQLASDQDMSCQGKGGKTLGGRSCRQFLGERHRNSVQAFAPAVFETKNCRHQCNATVRPRESRELRRFAPSPL